MTLTRQQKEKIYKFEPVYTKYIFLEMLILYKNSKEKIITSSRHTLDIKWNMSIVYKYIRNNRKII